MSNLIIEASLVNNDLMPYIYESDHCKDAVDLIAGPINPPVRNLRIIVKTKSGKNVLISIPNTENGDAIVQIDGETL